MIAKAPAAQFHPASAELASTEEGPSTDAISMLEKFRKLFQAAEANKDPKAEKPSANHQFQLLLQKASSLALNHPSAIDLATEV